MIKIGIDVSGLAVSKPRAGIENYTYHILASLQKIDNENQYFLYSNREIDFNIDNLKWHKAIDKSLLSASHTIWFNTVLVKYLKRDKIDVFWHPVGPLLPFYLPHSIKSIITVHDLVWKYFPETMEFGSRLIFNLFSKPSLNRSNAIIVDSNVTKESLKETFSSITNNKIHVVHLGIETDKFRAVDKLIAQNKVKERFKISTPYILFVGTIEPRKNLFTLLKVFALLSKQKQCKDYKLVLVGKTGWGAVNIAKLIKKSCLDAKKVIYLNYVEQKDLVYLYSGAEALVLISFYEGFGLPILEAMACGCPVIASKVYSMPEVSGGAALLVDPNNPQEIYETIYRVVIDIRLREEIVRKGIENVKKFSWVTAAQEMLRLMHAI